jgi:hypothetical protein
VPVGLRIVAPWFVAGVDIDSGGVAYHCAPIVRYMRGWTRERVEAYCATRRWMIEATP